MFAATHVVRGQALARVSATGARTEVGRIGQALALLIHLPWSAQALHLAPLPTSAWALAATCNLIVAGSTALTRRLLMTLGDRSSALSPTE